MTGISRRYFFMGSAGVLAAADRGRRIGANDKIVLGCMGLRGRAGGLVQGFAGLPDVEIAVLCDIDTRLFDKQVKNVEERQGKRPRTETDFRRMLEDPSIDAVVVGTPDHWHAIPTILACQAGKHVYVEKPASHNIQEGQVMLAAARRHNKVVQVGIQSRSGRHFEEACAHIRSGALGKVMFAKGWESAHQRPVPALPDSDPPPGVDYDMWLGPAPKRPFNLNRFHGSWKWYFDYGTGDLGNDGVHRIDYARRGLEAGFASQGRKLAEWPTAVSVSGGKYFFDDDQEWPDTMIVTWDYPGATLMYEMRIWSRYPLEGAEEGAAIYGENGYVVITNTEWRAYGPKGEPGPSGGSTNDEHDPAHKRNFLDCIRNGGLPSCDIAIGHVAASLTHMGNVAWRVNRKLHFDVTSQKFTGDADANRFLTRQYRKPWLLPKV